jgi:uncharacterized membrane protein
MSYAMAALHKGFHGWLALVFLWTVYLYLLLFFFRWLGVSWYHARKKMQKEQKTKSTDRDIANAGPGGWSAEFAS